MICCYKSVARQRRVCFTKLVWNRWNSNNVTGSSTSSTSLNTSETLDNKTQDDIKSRPDVENNYLDFPWERAALEIPEDIKIDDEEEELPWTNNEIEENPINIKPEVIDPSKNELILAPIKKKSSIIQKLQSKQKKPLLIENVNNQEANNFQLERDYKNLMQFKFNDNNDDFVNIIDELRPTNNIITIKQLSELTLTLDKSFKVNQLKQYISTSCPEISISKRAIKKDIINLIISKYWKLKITLDPTGDLVCETKIDLSNKRDLFLLLSNKGFLPQHWSLIGAQLSLGKSSKQLVVRGSKNIVNFVNASWNDLLNNISTDTLNLKKIKEFYKSINKKLNIKSLQIETGVFFDKVTFDENDHYYLSAIKNTSINQVKTEILKATEYRLGCNTTVINDLIEEAKKHNNDNDNNDDNDLLIKMDINDDSLPWYIKNDDFFRYAEVKNRLRESLLTDNSMIVELLSNEVQDLKIEVEEAKEKLEYNYVQNIEESNNNHISDNNNNNNKFFNISESFKEPSENILKLIDVNKIDKELNDVQIKEDSNKLMLDNVISVKFGKLYYNKKSADNRYFDGNLLESIRNLGKLNLMDKESTLFGSTGGILNRFNKQIHIKLIPNGFWNGKFENFINYPSIDLLVDLKDNKLEINKFSAIISEAEKNVEMGIPKFDIDLKFQNSYNSMLVYNQDQWILNGRLKEEFEKKGNNESEDNDIILNKKQINMFITQIGKMKLDVRYNQDLQEMLRQFNSKPYTFYFGKEKVKYCTVKVEFVRSIELEYEGFPVSLELCENGEYERVEVSMLKEHHVSMERFVECSISLSRFLSL
jgi:hypothetical protein